ncbi:hypothetical protein GCM10007304_40500 [Rhodococcoides trifolii]|uniref:DUF3239 domain-containing protein n=1 Tax=Rhodococcoides trifolii TaxID=908250 RepID=A0A917LGL0_9NOCA|nr:DUF3239 domain-containing protein [Rhodococcus trifolii]GGG22573.1 hypothetical protein GCM10007304_40500 [Rhodococcus trifolii]
MSDSARFDFAVDRAHAKAVDETVARARRRWHLSAAAAVVLAAVGVVLFRLDHPWSYILCVVVVLATIVALWVAVTAALRSRDVDDLYQRGVLVPAVVAGTWRHGVVLLSLIDVSKPDVDIAHMALVTRAVRRLPGHQQSVGEKVPSVAVLHERLNRTDPNTWSGVVLLPLAWATTDPSVIAGADQHIDELAWDLLHENLTLVDTIHAAENHRLLIDPHDLPAELLHKRH